MIADQPPTQLQYAPLVAAGQTGIKLLQFTDVWPVTQPPGTAPRGLMSWQNGTVGDWLPAPHGPATGYAETADGTPYTVTVAVNNFNLWRGSGPAAVHHEPPGMGPSCFDHSDQVASDGTTVWFAWLQINCADPGGNGIYVAPVSTANGEIGPPAQVPRPAGAQFADYDSTIPLSFVHRPGSTGGWLAYTLLVHGASHGFVYHTGDPNATDVGPMTGARLLAAATPAGRLWLGWFDNNTPHGTWLMHLRRLGSGTTSPEPGAWTLSLPAIATGAQAPPDGVRMLARDERLDVVAGIEAGGPGGPDGGVWHVRVG